MVHVRRVPSKPPRLEAVAEAASHGLGIGAAGFESRGERAQRRTQTTSKVQAAHAQVGIPRPATSSRCRQCPFDAAGQAPIAHHIK